MSNGNNVVDLLCRKYLHFTATQDRFLPRLETLPRKLPRLPHCSYDAVHKDMHTLTQRDNASLSLFLSSLSRCDCVATHSHCQQREYAFYIVGDLRIYTAIFILGNNTDGFFAR